MASLTRVIFSASSSGISMPNSSSRAITSSTVSRLSAPRSSTKDASGVTSSSSTPSWSTMIFFTRSATGSIKLLQSSPGAGEGILHGARGGAPPSSHMEAAVHGQDLARDVGRGVRDQEDHGPRHVLGTAGPAEGDGGGDGLAGLVGHGGGHVGL